MPNMDSPDLEQKQSKHLTRHLLGETTLPEDKFTSSDLLQRLTISGLNDWYSSKSTVAKVFWGAALLIAVIIFVEQVCEEVAEYIHNPILTSISFMPQTALPFPQVYLCPMNFANWDYIEKCGNKSEFIEKTDIFQPNFASILEGTGSRWAKLAPHLVSPGHRRTWLKIDCGIPKGEETLQQYLIRHALKIPMFLRECGYNTIGEPLKCSDIAEPVIDKEFGVCFLIDLSRLNNGFRLNQTTAALGLSLVIDIQEDIQTSSQVLIDGALVRVAATNDPAVFGGTLVHPGTYTRLSLAAKKLNLISSTKRSVTPQRCVEGEKHNLNILKNVEYSQQVCRMDCAQSIMLNRCNCVFPVDDRYLQEEAKNASYCSTALFDSCVVPALNDTEEINECTKECYRACKSVDIQATASQAKFPAKAVLRHLKKLKPALHAALSERVLEKRAVDDILSENNTLDHNLPQNNIVDDSLSENNTLDDNLPESNTKEPTAPRFLGLPYQYKHEGALNINDASRWPDNLIILDIAFEELEYTMIDQNPSRTAATFLSNLGGQAGLWLGASVFTMVQLIAYVVHMTYSRRIPKARSGKRKNRSSRRNINKTPPNV